MMKCDKTWGWVFLIVGILYLLQDLAVISFWNFNWWTALFVICGLMSTFGSEKR
mgnify:FL=1